MLGELTKPAKEVEILNETEELSESSYQIILHNDNVTPVPFVLFVLIGQFSLSINDATKKIVETERNGKARIARGFTFSEANKKVKKVEEICEENGQNLKLTIEEE